MRKKKKRKNTLAARTRSLQQTAGAYTFAFRRRVTRDSSLSRARVLRYACTRSHGGPVTVAGGGGSAAAVGAVRPDGERGETGRRPVRPAVGHGNGLAARRTLPGAAVCRTARRVARGSPRDPKDGGRAWPGQ